MSLPSWFTPQRMLIIFTCMSLVVYIDRGMIASTGVNGTPGQTRAEATGIQGDLSLSNFQDGCLPAAFMVGLMVFSPLFAEWSKTINAFKLVGTGLGIWMLGVAACGVSFDFWSLLLCRTLVGAGEASFVILTAPFIDDYAPPHYRSLWLSIFYMAIPVGYALGYIYGGVVGSLFGWRIAFFVEALFMLPFVIFSFCTKPIPLGVKAERSSDSGENSDDSTDGTAALLEPNGSTEHAAVLVPPRALWMDLRTVLKSPVLICSIIGNTVHTAILGMYSYWGPKAVMHVFAIKGQVADLTFGVVTVLTGILGTLTGGVVLDRVGASLSHATQLCLFSVTTGFVIVQLAFLFCRGLPAFVALFATGEFVLFMLSAPITTIILMTVPTKLRPLAFSVQTVSIHVFGDVPSPPLAGWIHDHVFSADDEAHPQSWRYTVILFNMLFLVGIAMFFTATSLTWPAENLLGGRMRWRRRQGPASRLDTVHEGETPSQPGSEGSLLETPFMSEQPLATP